MGMFSAVLTSLMNIARATKQGHKMRNISEHDKGISSSIGVYHLCSDYHKSWDASVVGALFGTVGLDQAVSLVRGYDAVVCVETLHSEKNVQSRSVLRVVRNTLLVAVDAIANTVHGHTFPQFDLFATV